GFSDLREVPVAQNGCLGVGLAEVQEESLEGLKLGLSEVILRDVHIVLGHPTNEANAHGVGVVAGDMRPDHFQFAAFLHSAITAEDEMVAKAGPALGSVPAVNILGPNVLRGASGRTMYNQIVGNGTLLGVTTICHVNLPAAS